MSCMSVSWFVPTLAKASLGSMLSLGIIIGFLQFLIYGYKITPFDQKLWRENSYILMSTCLVTTFVSSVVIICSNFRGQSF